MNKGKCVNTFIYLGRARVAETVFPGMIACMSGVRTEEVCRIQWIRTMQWSLFAAAINSVRAAS